MTHCSEWNYLIGDTNSPYIPPDHRQQDIEAAHYLAQHVQSPQGERCAPTQGVANGITKKNSQPVN